MYFVIGCFVELLIIELCTLRINNKLSDIEEILDDIRDLLKGGED